MTRAVPASPSRARHNIHELGSGQKTLVFGHGLGTNQSIWRLVAEKLAGDRRVVLLDWVGCGGADPRAFQPERYASLRGHAADLCALLRELDLGPITYVGHSAGGMIGVLAAISEPALFERLVLLMASPRYVNDPPDYFGGFSEADVDDVLQLMRDNFVGWSRAFATLSAGDEVVARDLEATFRDNDPGYLREFAEAVLRSDFRAELPKLTVPALVLASARDDMVPLAVSEYLHRHLPGSSYRCFDLSGHCPQLTHPELVAASIHEYSASRA